MIIYQTLMFKILTILISYNLLCTKLCSKKVIDLYNIVIYYRSMKQWTPEQIESFRTDYKLTRRAMGELLGVTVSTIYQWERRLRQPSTTAKILLSKIEKEFEDEGR